MRILLNRIKTPDGTVLTSYSVHDYQSYTDKNGKTYGVDGGTQYLRRTGDCQDCEDLSISIDENNIDAETFEIIRENLHWGTRGKKGDQPLKWIVLKSMDEDHLLNILNVYTGPIDPFIRNCFEMEILYRINLR